MEEEKKILTEDESTLATAPQEGAPEEIQEGAPEEIKEEEAPAAAGSSKKKEKPLTKGRRIANAIVLGVQIAFVVLAIVICLVVILNPKEEGEISPLGVKLLTVQTGSMTGELEDSFDENALVIATNPKDGGEGLQKGDIVSFLYLEEKSGLMIVVTHRIDEVVTENGFTQYFTKGDANAKRDNGWRTPNDILAVYAFHINGLGKAIKFIRDGYHFIYVIIIPLAVLLIYNIYLVAQMVVEAKMKKAKAAAAKAATASALQNASDEDLIRMLREKGIDASALLASQQEKKDTNDSE